MPPSHLFKPFDRSYWVIPGMFLAGAFPGAKDPLDRDAKIEGLLDGGIRTIINLMELDETNHDDRPFEDYQERVSRIATSKGIVVNCRRFPIVDLNVPSVVHMQSILDAVTSSVAEERPVYVHCWGGIGRTGTVVGCFLMQNGLACSENVLQVIADLRKHDSANHRSSPETKQQENFVKTWRDQIADTATGPDRGRIQG